jgi:acyl-CoA synthetase (AMP-forming)/AMP-acid ligase II
MEPVHAREMNVPNLMHFLERLEAQSRREAVIDPERGMRWTYAELVARVRHAGGCLAKAARGLPAEAPVAMSLHNGPAFLTTFLATICSGRAAMPLNPELKTDAFSEQLEIGHPCGIVVAPGPSAAREAAAARGLPCWEVREDGGWMGLDGCEGGGSAVEQTPETVVLYLHTSGTTGRPKRIALTQRNLLVSMTHIVNTYRLGPEDASLLVMPLFHVHGLVGAALATFFSGGRLIVPSRFSAGHFWGWVAEHHPTWYTAVPTIHQILLMRPEMDSAPRRAFRFIRSCSSPLAVATMQKLEERLEAPVLQAYGMTEAAHQIASNPLPPGRRKPGSVGLATGVEVAILDPAGNELPSGASGEVAIKGENVIRGYHGNPEANRTAFVREWFRTGDVGRLDEDGYLFLLGRTKEMINRGGEKISPVEVDAVLLEIPGVAQAVAFGAPDPLYGETVHAAVVTDREVGEQAILKHCRDKLPSFMVPARVHLLDAIPTGPTGKISRSRLPAALGLA